MDRSRFQVRKNNTASDGLHSSVVVPGTETEVHQDVNSLEIMKDFRPGPLDVYRKKATFDWKEMRMFFDGEEILRFKVSGLSKIKNKFA